MVVVEPRASFSIPAMHAKFDSKQATFHIPIFLLPITRQIFYKRYVCDIGQRVACSAAWADLPRTNRRLEVADSGDLESIARELPRNDLFKTRIRVSFGSTKAVTITVYYTTGTMVVQGNRCTSWVGEESSALMDTIRAVYILANHHTQPDLHKEVDEGLRLLPFPSSDNTSTQTTNVGDSIMRLPFVTAIIGESGPFAHPFRHGWLHTSHSHIGCHHSSVSQTKPPYPNPAQWRTTGDNQPTLGFGNDKS